jgi:hypothetical protein
MHRNLRVVVRAEKPRAFEADRPIAQRGTFSGTGDYADVERHL